MDLDGGLHMGSITVPPFSSAIMTLVADPRLTALERAGAYPALRWDSEAGRAYTVEGTTNLLDAPFAPLATGLVATPPENCYTNASPDYPLMFYRVRRWLP